MRISVPYFSNPALSELREKMYNTAMPEGKEGRQVIRKGMTEYDGEVPEE